MFGLPDLVGRDLETVQIGNDQMRQAVRLVKESLSLGGSGYLENPATSRVWLALARLLKKEFSSGAVHIVIPDICGYGT